MNDGEHKHRLLMHVLGDNNLGKVLVFTATKRGADRLAKKLYAQGHPAAALHGNLNQNQRNRAIAKLRTGEVQLLVATDVAARGIDVSGISHVINYDLPKVPEDYVHRIGRTGRAGAKGIAISFAAPEDRGQLRDIERYTRQPIQAHVIAGLEPAQGRSSARDGRSHHGAPSHKPRQTQPSRGNTAHSPRGDAPRQAQPQRHRKDFRHHGNGPLLG